MLVIFLLVDVYKINEMHKQENTVIDGHETIYHIVKGEITSDKIDFIVQHYKNYSKLVNEGNYSKEGEQKGTYTGYIFGDFYEFKDLFDEWKAIYNYPTEMNDICNFAKHNIHFFQKMNHSYEVSKNQKILTSYRDRRIDNYYNMEGTKKYLEYDFSSLLMFLMILAGVSGILMQEKQNKMFFLIETSDMGITKNIIAKLISVVFYTLFVVILFSIADMLFFRIIYGMEGLLEPLYSIKEYRNTPLNLSVIQYMILSAFMKYTALLFFGVIVFLLSFIFMDSVKTMAGSLLIFCVCVYLCIHSKVFINPVALFVNYNLIKEFSVINLFGIPVYYFQVILTALLSISIVISIGICIMSPHIKMSVKSQRQKKLKRGGIR